MDVGFLLRTISIMERGMNAFVCTEQYLQKGERLESLAKAHSEKTVRELSLSDWEESLYSGKWSDGRGAMLSKLKSFVGKYLQSMQSADDAYASTLSQMCGGMVSFELLKEKYFVKALLPATTQLEADEDIRMRLCIEGKEVVFGGVKNHPVNRKHFYFSAKHGHPYGDVRTALAYILLYCLVKKVVENTNDFAHGMFLEKYPYNAKHHARAGAFALRCLYYLATGKSPYRMEDNFPNYVREMVLHVPAELCLPKKVRELFEETVSVQEEAENEQTLLEKYPKDRRNIVLTKECVQMLFSDSYEYFLSKGTLPPEYVLVKESRFGSGTYAEAPPQFPYFDLHAELLESFAEILKIRQVQIEMCREHTESETEYAKSFQNRKSLPKTTISRMEQSSLNHYFGFVEFDEEVDFEKISVVEKQFGAMKDTYFADIDCSKVSIRFRKLGNHKASGLYYPARRCLCVDYRMPASFVHEFGHLIDAERGNLSLQASFDKVYQYYKLALERTVGEGAVVLKGKYDLKYYLKNTEVFARSFEIYCKECLQIDNTLLPKHFSEVYPEEERYRECVKAYFDALFHLKKEE